MEVSAIKHMGVAGAHGRSPLLRLQSDERLVALVRRGNQHAFEALVARYQSRLLAFCRHMLSSREDAEDVLQEVFTAAFNAMVADDRPINVRPWLYRIARNRSLNHLRRTQAVGVDSMDVHFSEGGLSTADKVHRREDFRLLITDVQDLPETQRTALLLREIDALSYEQIAEAMDNTVPSVKSLLVRARVALAEAAEARTLDCETVRFELGEVAEGLKRASPPVRRHMRSCERCASFKKQLASTNRALAALMPAGPLLLLKKSLLAHLGTTAAASGGAAAAVGTGGAGGILGFGIHTAASKTAAGLAAAALVTAGAVEVKEVAVERRTAPVAVATSSHDTQPSPRAAQAATAAGASSLPAAAPPIAGSRADEPATELAQATRDQRTAGEQAADDEEAAVASEPTGTDLDEAQASQAPTPEELSPAIAPSLVPAAAETDEGQTQELALASPPAALPPIDTRVGRPVATLPFATLDPSAPAVVLPPTAPLLSTNPAPLPASPLSGDQEPAPEVAQAPPPVDPEQGATAAPADEPPEEAEPARPEPAASDEPETSSEPAPAQPAETESATGGDDAAGGAPADRGEEEPSPAPTPSPETGASTDDPARPEDEPQDDPAP